MRRQKKFYAWGYADEGLTPEEIKPWESGIARRYGLSGFDVTPPPRDTNLASHEPPPDARGWGHIVQRSLTLNGRDVGRAR